MRRELSATLSFSNPNGEFTLRLGVTRGPAGIAEYLPELQQLEDTLVGLAVDSQERAGEPVTCRAGCAHCCRHLVPVTPAEALHLTRVVAALPPDVRSRVLDRFEAAKAALEETGQTEALRAGVADVGEMARAYLRFHQDPAIR